MHLLTKATTLLLTLTLILPMPLSGMVVYAQEAQDTPDAEADLDDSHDNRDLTPADLPPITDLGQNPETPLTRSFREIKDDNYTIFADEDVPAENLDNPFVTILSKESGVLNPAGDIFYFPNPADMVALGIIKLNQEEAGYVPVGRPESDDIVAATRTETTDDLTGVPAEPADTAVDTVVAVAAAERLNIESPKPELTSYILSLNDSLRSFISSDIRLSLSQADKTALIGENHGDCATWNEADDDFFPNQPVSFCDPPRVSKQVIKALHYLLTPKDQGGAGRDYLKVDRIVDFQERNREEDTTTVSIFSQLSSPYYVDFDAKPRATLDKNGQTQYVFGRDQQRAFSRAFSVSAIDRIRITTRIQKKGIFSTSNNYRFNAPIPIKVAWQSDEGITNEPLPTFSTDELITQLGTQSILDLLGESDAINDPSFAGRPLESIGLGDIARFLGGRLLSQLLSGQDIGRFNFGDTIKDFGVIAIAGALNLDPEVVRNAHNLQELEELTGRSWVGQQISLPSPLKGGTLNEILADIGRQRLAELLGVKSYPLTGYNSVDEFKVQLGQALIEERLPVPEHSFDASTKDEVRNAVGAGRFDLVFTESLASEIDERLGVEVGPTLSFMRTGDVAGYKRTLGNALFDSTIGRYTISQGAEATPLHPYQLYQQLYGNGTTIGGNGAQTIGTLAHVSETINDILDGGTYADDLLASLPESTSVSDGITRDIFIEQLRTIQTKLTEITALFGEFSQMPGNPCNGITFDPLSGQRPNCTIRNSGEQYYTTPQAAIEARNTFEQRFNSIQTPMFEAIEAANDISHRILATPAGTPEGDSDWASLGSFNLRGLRESLGASATASPLSDLALTLPETTSLLGTGDVFGGTSPGNPQTAASGIGAELNSALQAMQTYGSTYGSGNPEGYESANRRDQYYNFPAGTLFSAVGGQSEETAFADIGVWTLSQRLTNRDEQVVFRTAVNNARLRAVDGPSSFTPSAAEHQYLADVFLTIHPSTQFRRLGRRILVDRLQNSAQATSVTALAQNSTVVQDILFYTQRLQIINTGVETLRQAAADLRTTSGDEISTLASQLHSLLNPSSLSSVSIGGTQRVVRESNNLLSQLRYNVETNTTLPQINSRVLPALRNIERATMEILEGKPLTYQSGIPAEISVGINGANNGNNQIGGTCDAPNNGLLDTAQGIIGSDNFANIFGGDDLVLNALGDATSGGSFDDILRFVGSAKLGDLLELPQATFDIYLGPGINLSSVDDFFYSVGVGHIMARCNSTGSMTRDEFITAGREYIARVSIPALANKLNINLPDWITAEDVAGLVLGNPTDVLFGIGARQVEERLSLPQGFLRGVVMPEGATEAERQRNRERTIVEATLLKFDIELELPAGFTLTDNLVESMGQARIEQILNMPTGTFFTDPNDTIPEREEIVVHLVNYYFDQYVASGYEGDVGFAMAAVSGRERFTNGFGIGLDTAGRGLQQAYSRALSEFTASDASSRAGKEAALNQASADYVANLQATIDGIFADSLFSGSFGDNAGDPDAASRQAFFDSRLTYIDDALGIDGHNATDPSLIVGNNGTTRKWLIGQINTTDYITAVGSGTAQIFATSAFIAGLRRFGITGHWLEVIGSDANIDLILDVFNGTTITDQKWSQLFTMFSDIFSINFDEILNFDGGTFARIIAHPSQADEILVDQGVRLFSEQVLGVNLDSLEYDSSINVKRVMQAAMYGAAWNPETGNFEAFTFESGVRLNGDLAVVYAMGEVNDMALEYLTQQIRGDSGANDELWRFIRVPITFVHDAFEGRLQTMGMRNNYVQEATSARQSWDDHVGDPVNQNRVLTTAEGHRLTAAASGAQPSFGGQNENDNMWQDLGAVIQSGRVPAPNGATQSLDLVTAQSTVGNTDDVSSVDHPVIPADGTNLYLEDYYGAQGDLPIDPETANDAATAHIEAAEQRQQVIDVQRTTMREMAIYMIKDLAYASMDFGIEKLFDFPAGIIAPGIARALIEGNPQQRMNAIFYIGAKYALQEFTDEIPEWLRPFADFNTLHQAASFILNLDRSSASVQAAFQAGGLFSKVQTAVFPNGLFGEINLPEGTFGAIVGLMVTGSTDDFHIGTANFQGLGNLFNTQSLLRIGFDFAEKWLDIDTGTLWQAYNNTYEVYKAYDAYNTFNGLAGTGEGIIALANSNAEVAQILSEAAADAAVEAGVELGSGVAQEIAADNLAANPPPAVQAAQQAKSAQLQANLIQAGVTLALFAVNMLFGKQINRFESALGLPPGTIMQAVGLAATAIIQLLIIGSLGPMFWVGLGIFVLTTLLGFGVVKIRMYGTADGYYPFVGELGQNSPASPNGEPPYAQWPSADILDNTGNIRTTSLLGEECSVTTPTGPDDRVPSERPSDCQQGWFDPRNQEEQKINFQQAARVKVMGLVRDLFAAEYATGKLPENDRIGWTARDYPKKVVLDQIEEGDENNYYLGASNPYLQPAKISFNQRAWIKTGANGLANPEDTANITCTPKRQWGVCTSDKFEKVVHVQW